MKNAIYISLGLFILLLELVFFNNMTFLGIGANIIVIYIAILSILTSLDRVLFISLVLGLGKDFIFERIYGINALIFLLIAILFGKLQGSIYKEKWTISIFLSGISSVVYMVLYTLFYKMYLGKSFSFLFSLKRLGPFFLVQVGICLILYYPISRIIQLVEDRW